MLLWYYSIYYYYYFGGCYIIIIAKLWTGYRFGGTKLLSLALKIMYCLLIRQIRLIWFDALDRESQCVQRDETCFSFLSYSPQPILYPIPPGVLLHCCFIGGWLLSPVGSRHFPRQHNYKVHLGSVLFFFFFYSPQKHRARQYCVTAPTHLKLFCHVSEFHCPQ